MVTKKRKFKRPTIENIYIDNISTAETAYTEMWKLNAERSKATDMSEMKGEDVPQPTWRDVITLLGGQTELLRLINQLYILLEDPVVKPVIELKTSIDEMKRKIDDLHDELNHHVSCYSHSKNDSYY